MSAFIEIASVLLIFPLLKLPVVKTLKTPSLNLLIKLSGDSQYTCIRNVTYDDVKLINEFLNGQLKHIGERDEESPLISHIDRIKELILGRND